MASLTRSGKLQARPAIPKDTIAADRLQKRNRFIKPSLTPSGVV
jgi:hypothetical protein